MKKIYQLLTFVAIMIVVSTALAFNVPTPTGYVTDTSGSLTTSQIRTLNRRLTDYQRSSNNEIAVLMVPTLNGDNIEDVTQQAFQSYKVGKSGLDNGVLLLVAVQDHKMRLQTGKGVEGDLTDIQSNDILVSMKPYFRKKDFFGGINKALDQVQARLDTRVGQKADPVTGQQFNQPVQPLTTESDSTSVPNNNHSFRNDVGFLFGFLAFVIVSIVLFRFFLRKKEEKEKISLRNYTKSQIDFENRQRELTKESSFLAERRAEMVRARAEAKEACQLRSETIMPLIINTELNQEEVLRRRRERLLAEEHEIERRERTEASLFVDDDNDDFDRGSSGSGSDDSGFGGGESGGGGSSDDW